MGEPVRLMVDLPNDTGITDLLIYRPGQKYLLASTAGDGFIVPSEELLAQTISAAQAMRAVRPSELDRVIVDSTVQEKAIAYPTDSRLLEVARGKLVKLARHHGLKLRQSYEREGPSLRRRASGYAHAKQFK